MPAEKIHIDKFLELAKQYPVFDVRSPGEYNHAHIPGAISFPLFSDEERKIVGTAYKQQSREEAIKIGLDFFGPKMKTMVEEAESLVDGHQPRQGSEPHAKDSKLILVHCWRGGMRSSAVAWLLDLYGFKVNILIGGYKKFRHYVLDSFKLPFQFKILGGYTGSGKTELLKELQKRGEAVIDLEGIANHKGSAFGNIGLPSQPGQEMFENMLAQKMMSLLKAKPDSSISGHHLSIWVEDESQRIGQVNIPADLWKKMRRSPLIFLDIPFEERLQHIVREYGQLNTKKLTDAINRISQKLGNLNAKTAILLLNDGKISESFTILLKYYDKHYLKGLHNREELNSLLNTIECKSITTENASLLATKFLYHSEKL